MRFIAIKLNNGAYQVEDTRHKDFGMPKYSSTINLGNMKQALQIAEIQNKAWIDFLTFPT